MSTKTDFYLGRGHDAAWLGSLQWECEPDNLLRVPPGRLVLTATDEPTYRAAVVDLFIVWETEGIGAAYPRRVGWPWPWPTSHVNSWIVTFVPDVGGVFATVGGGVRWERARPAPPSRTPHRRPRPTGHPGVATRTRRPALGPASTHARPRHRTTHRCLTVPHQPARHRRRRPMTAPNPPEVDIVPRSFTENGCTVTSIIYDPADAQQVLYGVVTRDGVLVGSYYCADRVRQCDWRIVTADGHELTRDGIPVRPLGEGSAVFVLTTILTAPKHEIEQRLRDATRPPR